LGRGWRREEKVRRAGRKERRKEGKKEVYVCMYGLVSGVVWSGLDWSGRRWEWTELVMINMTYYLTLTCINLT
jgi:hypothetical protein